MATIKLGICDSGAEPPDRREYLRRIHEPPMLDKLQLRGEKDGQWMLIKRGGDAEVAGIQRFLKKSGLFSFGKIDGLCGYRTSSTVRLFQ